MEIKQVKKLLKMNTLELTSTGYWEVFRFELDSVDVGQNSGVIALPVNAIKGCLTEVKFQSESEKIDIALLTQPGAQVESIDCLYSKKDINRYSVEVGLQSVWARYSHKDAQTIKAESMQNCIYLIVDNKGTKASGVTVIEIVAQVHSN